jgi:long-chain fatty acid transport protein
MRHHLRLVASAILSCLSTARTSHATTEPPSFFDARSVGMGSTGVAYIHNGSSLFHNVAAMEGIGSLAVTGVFGPAIPSLTTPARGPNTEVKSETNIAPVFLLGGAYRLSDKIVVGAGVFGTGGFGAEYAGLGEVMLVTVEAAPGISYAITDQLAIGLEYRISYLMQHSEVPLDPTNPALGRAITDMSGLNFLGAHAGVFYRPNERLRFGLVYRSKVTTELTGETETPFGTVDVESEFSNPHHFKLGTAYEAIEKKLLLALDFRYLLHGEANKEIVIRTTEGPPQPPVVQRLDWENAFVAGLGAEYNVSDEVPLRLGYSLTKSATPTDGAGLFFLPPGLVHALHAGAGVRLTSLDIDLGGYYALGAEDVSPNPERPDVIPGRYELDIYAVALSVTFRQ